MQTNNKLREALAYLFTLIDMRKLVLDCDETEEISAVQVMLDECRAALAEPVKNYEVGTVEEQVKRFDKFCDSNTHGVVCGYDCPMRKNRPLLSCKLIWAQMPYTEGGAK